MLGYMLFAGLWAVGWAVCCMLDSGLWAGLYAVCWTLDSGLWAVLWTVCWAVCCMLGCVLRVEDCVLSCELYAGLLWVCCMLDCTVGVLYAGLYSGCAVCWTVLWVCCMLDCTVGVLYTVHPYPSVLKCGINTSSPLLSLLCLGGTCFGGINTPRNRPSLSSPPLSFLCFFAVTRLDLRVT